MTIKQVLREMVQLNHDQAFSYTREELIAILDEVLGEYWGEVQVHPDSYRDKLKFKATAEREGKYKFKYQTQIQGYRRDGVK